MTDMGCQRPGARESDRASLGVRKNDTESARVPGPAQRLEDVEKVVRKILADLAELQEWALECNDAIMTRVEALEDNQGPRVVRSFLQIPHDYT